MSEVLPIVNCDGCMACCLEMGGPPGYSTVILNPDLWPQDTGDHERVRKLPLEAMRLLMDGWINREDFDYASPCCWLDTEHRVCRFYGDRPQVCRDFEVGCLDCRHLRYSKC